MNLTLEAAGRDARVNLDLSVWTDRRRAFFDADEVSEIDKTSVEIGQFVDEESVGADGDRWIRLQTLKNAHARRVRWTDRAGRLSIRIDDVREHSTYMKSM